MPKEGDTFLAGDTLLVRLSSDELATLRQEPEGVKLKPIEKYDLPGAEAPAAWLHYLRGGSAANLRRVMQHNAQDLKSLAGILTYLAGMDACVRYHATASSALSRGDGLSCAACGAGACAHHNAGISTPAGAVHSSPTPSPSHAEDLLDHPRRSAGAYRTAKPVLSARPRLRGEPRVSPSPA